MSQSFSGDDPLSILEHNLARTLKPVLPNPDFVKKLGYRIVNPPVITVENRTGLKALVFFAFALFTGILLIWLLITLNRFFSERKKSN